MIQYDLPAIVSSLGLALDMVGVILIFYFGIAPKIDRGGVTFLITEQVDEHEKQKAKKYDFFARAGLVLLVVGFGLQLLSNWL